MPCDSGLTPTEARENKTQLRLMENVCYVLSKIDPDYMESAHYEHAYDCYVKLQSLHMSRMSEQEVDYWSDVLCSAILGFSEVEENAIIYDGRSKQARQLADWWEDHQERDKARKLREKEARAEEKANEAYEEAFEKAMAEEEE